MAINSFDVYLEMEGAWRFRIPKPLQGIKPSTLIAMLELAAAVGGTSQKNVTSKLGLTQWGVSKISKKLLTARWVTVSRGLKPNHRQKLMTLTARGRAAMDDLDTDLRGAIRRFSPKQRTSGGLVRARQLLTPISPFFQSVPPQS